jgi:hypothetical protein
LREAIQLANGNAAHDTIEFAQSLAGAIGTATITLSLGELSITSDITVNGLGAGRLAIHGKEARVFAIAAGVTVDLNGLTISGGRASQGGGVFNRGALAIAKSVVSGNSVTMSGGGIYNSELATLSITDSTLSDNSVIGSGEGSRGGGIYNLGVLSILSTTISGNYASSQGSSGGGIYNQAGSVSITNSTISGNLAHQTGGIDNNATEPTVLVRRMKEAEESPILQRELSRSITRSSPAMSPAQPTEPPISWALSRASATT